MHPNELHLIRDLVANLQTTILARLADTDAHVAKRFDDAATRFDGIDDRIGGIHERLDLLNGRVRKLESSNTRLKVVAGGLIALAAAWLKSTLHF